MPRRRRGGGGKKRGYYWDGLQFPATTVPSTGASFELIGPTTQEFMPGTLVRIRGHLTLMSTDVSSTEVGMKIMYLEVNDAGTITGDAAGIDTHEEDIARRQLWTYYTTLRGATAGQPDDVARIEVDVKSKLKLEASGKMILALLADATTSSRASVSGYLRCLVMHG